MVLDDICTHHIFADVDILKSLIGEDGQVDFGLLIPEPKVNRFRSEESRKEWYAENWDSDRNARYTKLDEGVGHLHFVVRGEATPIYKALLKKFKNREFRVAYGYDVSMPEENKSPLEWNHVRTPQNHKLKIMTKLRAGTSFITVSDSEIERLPDYEWRHLMEAISWWDMVTKRVEKNLELAEQDINLLYFDISDAEKKGNLDQAKEVQDEVARGVEFIMKENAYREWLLKKRASLDPNYLVALKLLLIEHNC